MSPRWLGAHPAGQGVIRVPGALADGDRVLEAPATTEMGTWCQCVPLGSVDVMTNTTLKLLVFQISWSNMPWLRLNGVFIDGLRDKVEAGQTFPWVKA